MSNIVKINAAFFSILGGVVVTSASVIWFASAKASEIDSTQLDVMVLKNEMSELKKREMEQAQTLSRLDERTVQILELIKRK